MLCYFRFILEVDHLSRKKNRMIINIVQCLWPSPVTASREVMPQKYERKKCHRRKNRYDFSPFSFILLIRFRSFSFLTSMNETATMCLTHTVVANKFYLTNHRVYILFSILFHLFHEQMAANTRPMS